MSSRIKDKRGKNDIPRRGESFARADSKAWRHSSSVSAWAMRTTSSALSKRRHETPTEMAVSYKCKHTSDTKQQRESGANHLVAGQKPKVDTRLQNVRNGLGHLVLRATCVSKQINEPLLEANLQLVLDGGAADEFKVVLDRRKRLGQARLAMTNGGVRGEETLMVCVKLFALDQSG